MLSSHSSHSSLLRPALVLLAAFTLLLGAAYPALVTGVAQTAFGFRANGSLLTKDGRTTGSALIGQPFSDPSFFWGRPSATSIPYDGGASSGSNLGPSNPALHDAVTARLAALHASDPANRRRIPVDLVTASGSGLDPHVSPASADWQVPRVARARGLSEESVRALVARHTEGRTLGVLGEPRVNVLELNLELTTMAP